MDERWKLTKRSGNRKIGTLPVTMSARSTCPDACPLRGDGCYAEQWPMVLHWDRLDAGAGLTWSDFLGRIRALGSVLWRWAQAGDLPGERDRLDRDRCLELASANRGRPIAYTHYPIIGPEGEHNRETLKAMADRGFPVNVSANTPGEVDLAMAAGLPAVCILGKDAPIVSWTPEGRKIVRCPATVRDTDCKRCKLCAVADRPFAVGFPVHGAHKKATKALSEYARAKGES